MKDVIIIGSGIVGLATAFKLLKQKPDLNISIIEKEEMVAKHQTGNNSGVIHSGLYYKPGSLKAENCLSGYHQLINFCKENNIRFDLCGKIVVATDESEIPYLETLLERGKQNGLEGLKILKQDQIKEHEPHATGVKGVFVPQTGIVDYSLVALKLAELIETAGGEFCFGEKVIDVELKKSKATVITDKGSHEGKIVVNCAGLYSDKIALMAMKKLNIRIIPFRGEYYKLAPEKEHLVKNLIYPVPNPNFPFLGVHFTRMAKGGVEAGPNAVLAFSREGYKKSDVNISELLEALTWPGFLKVASKYWKIGMGEMYRSFSKKAFTTALQKLIPEIHTDDLITGGAGVRAQACDIHGGLIDDFLFFTEKNMLNVCNAPSPAATSSLSIGDKISSLAMNLLNESES